MDRYLNRIAKLRSRLDEALCDAFLAHHPPSLSYLTGYRGDSAYLLVGPQTSIFYTDGRYTTQAAAEIPPELELVRIHSGEQFLRQLAESHPQQTLGIDENQLSANLWLKLRERLGREPRAAATTINHDRIWKDPEEIKALRQAVAIAEKALAAARPQLQPGIHELEIAAEMEYQLRRAGGSAAAFPLIVASGPRSALPHGVASPRTIAPGDPVTIDFGAVYNGYHSDQTCTFFLGEPDSEQRRVYDTLLAAQRAGFETLNEMAANGSRLTARELDGRVRRVVEAAGLGAAFSHGTGHGVGLEIHEAPSISPHSPEQALEPGMVFTIEPGCYFAERWGIRIEDTVHLTPHGAERLTTIDKQLENMIIA